MSVLKSCLAIAAFILCVMCGGLNAAQRFNAAIDMPPDSIAFVSYVCRSCYEDGHAGNRHSDVGYEKTTFRWKNAHDIEEACVKWFFHEKFTEQMDQVGAIVYRPDARLMVIAFRGSVYDKDWKSNLQATHADVLRDGVSVHAGFKGRYDAIVPFNDGLGENHVDDAMLWNIRRVIDSEGADQAQVQFIFTGHSAGAALATIAAFKLKTDEAATPPYNFNALADSQIGLVTFSSPRVGDRRFAEKLVQKLGEVNVLRFRCSSDTVPNVPPEKSGYVHAGIEITVTTAEKAFDDDDDPTRYFNYIRSSRFYKLLMGYSFQAIKSGVSSLVLPIAGASVLSMHSMPSERLAIEALNYASERYHSGEVRVPIVGKVSRISSQRRFFYVF